MRSLCLALPSVALVALTLATPAHSEEYLPLTQGMRWRYQGIEGFAEIQTIDGTRTIWGTPTFIKKYIDSSSNEGLENYWTNNADGDALLWGFDLTADDFGLVYNPPITMVDAPLFLGKTWSVTTAVYELPDLVFVFEFTINFTVTTAGPLSVPAGTFESFGIYYEQSPPVSITGAAVSTSRGTDPQDWYSDGVGLVQYDANDLYQLVEYGLTTSTDNTTWGAIKGLYK